MTDRHDLPRWQQEFPDFDGMDFEMPEGFVDVSNRGEGRPMFFNEELGLTLHVDHVDMARREFPDSPRFHLLEEGDDRCGSADPLIAESDDIEIIRSEIEAYAAANSPGLGRP